MIDGGRDDGVASDYAVQNERTTKLATYNRAWELDLKVCPCDAELVSLVKTRSLRNSAVFHFGTGAHHLIGRELAATETGNSVLGVTASSLEYNSYIELVSANPTVALAYKVLFCDIYTLNEPLLPIFDVSCLFHLCEFFDRDRNSYAPLDDWSLLQLIIRKTRYRGLIVLYSGSFAFEKAKPLLQQAVINGLMREIGPYDHLLLFERI